MTRQPVSAARRAALSAALPLLVLLLAAAGLLATFSAAPLAMPGPWQGAVPKASPPPELRVFQLPTGVLHRSAAFAYRGGSYSDKRDFAATAVLVEHPAGDLLIDTGFGRAFDAQFASMPAFFQAITSYRHDTAAADLLAQAGYDTRSLRGILLTHAHWDHVSGLPDFPGVPVLLTEDERAFIRAGGASTALIRSFRDVRFEEYQLESGPYLGFARSHDLYGDGSVVVVAAAGHTPGSVIVFLTLPSGRRYALVGDLAWQREGITELEERAWPLRMMVDADRQGVRENLLHMKALALRFPELILVPAHDLRGFSKMPELAAP